MTKVKSFQIKKYSKLVLTEPRPTDTIPVSTPLNTWYHFPQRTSLLIAFIADKTNIGIYVYFRGDRLEKIYLEPSEYDRAIFMTRYPSIGFKLVNEKHETINRFQVTFDKSPEFEACIRFINSTLLVIHEVADKTSTSQLPSQLLPCIHSETPGSLPVPVIPDPITQISDIYSSTYSPSATQAYATPLDNLLAEFYQTTGTEDNSIPNNRSDRSTDQQTLNLMGSPVPNIIDNNHDFDCPAVQLDMHLDPSTGGNSNQRFVHQRPTIPVAGYQHLTPSNLYQPSSVSTPLQVSKTSLTSNQIMAPREYQLCNSSQVFPQVDKTQDTSFTTQDLAMEFQPDPLTRSFGFPTTSKMYKGKNVGLQTKKLVRVEKAVQVKPPNSKVNFKKMNKDEIKLYVAHLLKDPDFIESIEEIDKAIFWK